MSKKKKPIVFVNGKRQKHNATTQSATLSERATIEKMLADRARQHLPK